MGKLFREAQAEVTLSAGISWTVTPTTRRSFSRPRCYQWRNGEALVENASLGVTFCVEPWNFRTIL